MWRGRMSKSGSLPRPPVKLVLLWCGLVTGLAILAWPVVSDWVWAWRAQHTISEITDVYDDMDDPARLENLAQANAWNAKLYGKPYEEPAGGLWEYTRQLTYRSPPDSMIAWLDVPKIGTKLPIYHGTGQDELMAGVGHCDWSALPVGGEGTRCVLTAHSGMRDTRMFDDIRNLEHGDQFVLWTLGEPRAYKVINSEVFVPEDAALVLKDPEPGRDLCCLVTCTPFNVNTHRLVVTGERCPYEGDETVGVEAYVNNRTIPLLVGIGALLFLIVLLIVRRIKRKVHKKREV